MISTPREEIKIKKILFFLHVSVEVVEVPREASSELAFVRGFFYDDDA